MVQSRHGQQCRPRGRIAIDAPIAGISTLTSSSSICAAHDAQFLHRLEQPDLGRASHGTAAAADPLEARQVHAAQACQVFIGEHRGAQLELAAVGRTG